MAKIIKLRLLKILTVLAFALMLWGAFALSAEANYLDFFIGPMHPSDAEISFDGGYSNPLEGENINVLGVIGVNTTSHSGVFLAITNGRLNFTTGNLTGFSSNEWDFGASDDFTITGGIASLGIADGTTLVSGSFNSAKVFHAASIFNIGFGDITDTKHEDLTEYYGFPEDQVFAGKMNLAFFTEVVSPPGAFSSEGNSISSGDLVNLPVPVPPSLLLLGSGLLGLGLMPRRKKAAA